MRNANDKCHTPCPSLRDFLKCQGELLCQSHMKLNVSRQPWTHGAQTMDASITLQEMSVDFMVAAVLVA